MVQNSNPKRRAPFAGATALHITSVSVICLSAGSAWGQVSQNAGLQASASSDPILIAQAAQGSPSTNPAAGNQSQSSATSAILLEEVLVTARRLNESLQQVPIAVTVIDQDTLERQGVNTLTDLQ